MLVFGGGLSTPCGLYRMLIFGRTSCRCRSCTSKSAFSAFAAQATKQPTSSNPTIAKASLFNDSSTSTSTSTSTTHQPRPRVECPPDVEALGRSSWTLLHSIAATYPDTPDKSQQNDLVSFVGLFSKLYPCWVCADDFQGYIARAQPRVGSRDEFGWWLCGAHNEVNRKLGKPVFDCSRWKERWVTGPKDGSCD